jgi:hypothetical protein
MTLPLEIAMSPRITPLIAEQLCRLALAGRNLCVGYLPMLA